MNTLETHLRQKITNHEWLSDCLEGKAESFPFRPNENGKATIGSRITPIHPSTSQIVPCKNNHPQFIVNIPLAHKPSMEEDYEDLLGRFEKLKLEGFSTTGSSSSRMIKRQVATVVAINQICSIDPALNRSFTHYIRHIPQITSVVHRIIGFFWRPVWTKTCGTPHIYPIMKAFLLLKALSAEKAEKVRQTHEMPEGLSQAILSQIPFQKIRETGKCSPETSSFVEYAKTHAPKAPIYFTIMDADFLSLRVKTGIFSRLTTQILEKKNPSVVCLGYQVANNERPLIRLGIKMDMVVREAMASVVPYAPYFCEPCTAFLIRRPQEKPFLDRLSFIGRGRTLESRRFIESGRKKKLFDNSVIFVADGGVTTTTPQRMRTQTNEHVVTLAPDTIKQKRCLRALRDISQTHATPKQWADNMYNGLDFTCPQVRKATPAMMHIFAVFDPIARMFSFPRFSKKVFDEILREYDNPLSTEGKTLLATAKTKLLSLGMKKEMTDLVEEAARKSGKAIQQVLLKASAHTQ